MKRTLAFVYGAVSYLVFLLTFLYAIGFVGNMVVPKSIDSGIPTPGFAEALIINMILLSVFAIQHSVMARPAFKQWWTKFVPEPIERSTYVLFASLSLVLVFWQWRPMTGIVWNFENSVVRYLMAALFFLGWAIVLISTFLINHFDLFGLRQVYLYHKGKDYTPLNFAERSLYKLIRHPIMLGFIIAFWATPTMTTGHLLFAAVTTAYILVAIQLEERDSIGAHGEAYEHYRKRVGMLVPLPRRKPQPRSGGITE